MANEILPGTATGSYLVNEVWNRRIERNVYDRMDFANNIGARERLYNQLHLPKMSRFTYSTLAQGTFNTALTNSANSETEATLSPAGIYIQVVTDENQLSQGNLDFDSAFTAGVEDGLAEGIETLTLANLSSLSTYQLGGAGASIDASTWRSGVGKIPKGARSKGQPGKADIHIILPTGQYANALGIPEFTNADMRGDGTNPNVRGIFVKGAGATLHLSNVLPTSSGTSKYGAIWIPEAFGISWNKRVSVQAQKWELQHKIIGYANFGSAIVWDNRAVRLELDDPS